MSEHDASSEATPETVHTRAEDVFLDTCAPIDHEKLWQDITHNILRFLGRDPEMAGKREIYLALAYTLRDILVTRWIRTQKEYYAKRRKRVYYLSLEFLIGRSLGNALVNMNLYDEVEKALAKLGYDLSEIREEEEDAALGNGGLGRLAACFMDSIATLRIPAYGYGILYEYGIFFQKLANGQQVELPDNWLRYGSPWQIARAKHLHPVQFFGHTEQYVDEQGRFRSAWVDTEEVMAMACDFLVPGYRNRHVINMRLWTARASRELDLSSFQQGDYVAAVQNKVQSETISKVLYPSDDIREGQKLRFKQQYFFVAATFQDIFRRYKKKNKTFDEFADTIAVQLNDTHPAIAIPELMRLLVDIELLDWDKAWDLCVKTFGYTNHTLMPEALETWPVEIFARILPRHLEIIYEINRRFLDEVNRRYPGDLERLRRLSLIEEGPVKKVRMAHLAVVGSHSVNGVAELHSHLLRTRIFPEFHELYPGKFNNKTNGITQRRWLLKANPQLAALITESIGDAWVTDLYRLRDLEKLADDLTFQKKWRQVKKNNKMRLARFIFDECGVAVNHKSIFDVHVKRIHEYKRQLLNILHVITYYHRLLSGKWEHLPARTFIFAGKAAPSYRRAKDIIRLITSVAQVVNGDPRSRERLQVVFVPNYGVSVAEKIIPATDLSEQISTAGTEASGTGNMKFALNGALTIGTLDGANIEIREEVGEENIFIFGLTADRVDWERLHPGRTPESIHRSNPEIRRTVDSLLDGSFTGGDRTVFQELVASIMNPHDPYLVLRDLEDYIRCQIEVGKAYKDQKTWTRKAILNVARMGKFSTDRTIAEYAQDIWGISPEDPEFCSL